jgi:hypothetical protein
MLVRVHAAGVRVHAACAYPCCMFIFMLFTLEVYVRAACPGPSCIPKAVYWMSMSMMHVNVHTVLHVHVHASCPCPCCMSMSMLHVHVFSCPWCMPMLLVHAACMLHVHAVGSLHVLCCISVLVHDAWTCCMSMVPCGMSMNNVFACLRDSQTYQNITYFRFRETWAIRENRVDIFAKRDLVRHTILATKKLWNETHRQRWPPNQSSLLLCTAGTLKYVNFFTCSKICIQCLQQ